MPQLLIYLPIVLIFAVDFLFFGSHMKKEEEPKMWLQRNARYNIELAARREDFGYGSG